MGKGRFTELVFRWSFLMPMFLVSMEKSHAEKLKARVCDEGVLWTLFLHAKVKGEREYEYQWL